MSTAKFRARRPLFLRLWHWANAALILGLLGTVFLRKGWLSWRGNAELIEKQAASVQVTLPEGFAQSVARHMRDVMWEWHYVFGWSLAAVLFGRLLIAYFSEKQKPSPANDLHVKAVKASYMLFYVLVTFMTVSGTVLYSRDVLGLPEQVGRSLKEMHEVVMWFFVAFSFFHVAGVVVAENRGDPGLVSDMINGGEETPPGSSPKN